MSVDVSQAGTNERRTLSRYLLDYIAETNFAFGTINLLVSTLGGR